MAEAADPVPRGRFIVLEGGEGSGKSTQVARLAARLRGLGHEVVETREPGGSLGAEAIRALLLQGEDSRWDAETEALLHTAARRDHCRAIVWPALDEGRWVVCDRFTGSTVAYQAHAGGVDEAGIRALQAFAIGAFRPDLVLLLDIPVEDGLERARTRGRLDRYDSRGPLFHEAVRRGFLAQAQSDPHGWAVIDARPDMDAVERAIWAATQARLGLAP